MSHRTLSFLLLLAACKGGEDSATPTGTVTGTPTGTPTGGTDTTPPVGEAVCSVDSDNGLRVHCTASLESAGHATATFIAAGAPERSFRSEEPGTVVSITGWGLKPETTYTWTIGESTGTVTTAALPSPLQGAQIQISGAPVGYDAVLLPMNCNGAYLTMVDGDGDIVWYEGTALYANGMDAYDWSQADRSLLVGKGGDVEEIHVSGELRGSWGGYDGDVHHDLERWGAYTYLLFDYQIGQLFVDGIHVFEGATLLGTIRLGDHFTVSGGGGGGPLGADWSHANGIQATEDGQIVMSLRAMDSVLSIDGDPSSPTFLDILWIADGNGAGALPGADYTVQGSGFGDQHNASLFDGSLWLFDNVGAANQSRAARYRLDDSAGTVVLEEAWPVGALCNIEGGAIPLGGGGVLATCATNRDILQFEAGSTTPIFELNAGCGGAGPSEAMNRGIPVVIE